VYYGTSPGTYQWNFDAGNQISAPINVSPGYTYYFVVRAYNASLEYGPPSSEASINLATAPGAPTASITATLQSANTALVTWQTANATSASINGVSVPLTGSGTVNVTQTTTFTLTATGSGGTATASATVTVATATAPGDPSGMAASVSGSRATLSWRAPTTGGTATSYRLNVGTYSGGTNITNGLNVGNVLSVRGDLPRGKYYARVRAANAAGMSLYSNEVYFRVGKLLRTPTGFQVTWQGTTATLSWTAPAADTSDDVPNNYVLEAGTAQGLSDVARVSVGNRTSFSADVSRGTYYVRVKAVNDVGESDPTEDLEVRAPGSPNAPTYFMASGEGSTVDLRWTAPSGPAPTAYIIEAGSAPGRSDLAVLRVGNVTHFSTQAPPGVYYVRVRGVNAIGVGAASTEVVVRR
jgi:hypothetical protein